MIRDANFVDIPAIVSMLESAYAGTHYARDGIASIDTQEAKRLLVQSIQRHGQKHGGATWLQVAVNDGVVTGFILGTLVRLYSIADRLMATDLFWYAGPASSAQDADGLMRAMIGWARTCPAVVEIKCATTAIMADPDRSGKLLRRIGMEPYGNIYRMEVT